MTARPVSRAALSALLGLGAALLSATYACSSSTNGATGLHDVGGGGDGGAVVGQDGGSGHDAASSQEDGSSHDDASQDATQDSPGQDGASDAADESTFQDVSQDHNVYNEDGGPADAPIAVWDGA